MSVSADYLAGSVNAAAVAKYYGVKVFVNISQMTLALRTYRYCRHMQTYRRPGTFSPEGKLLSQTMWASSANFYQAAPANYYAKFWHDNAVNGKAYGFPYDDVGGYSSYISHNSPR